MVITLNIPRSGWCRTPRWSWQCSNDSSCHLHCAPVQTMHCKQVAPHPRGQAQGPMRIRRAPPLWVGCVGCGDTSTRRPTRACFVLQASPCRVDGHRHWCLAFKSGVPRWVVAMSGFVTQMRCTHTCTQNNQVVTLPTDLALQKLNQEAPARQAPRGGKRKEPPTVAQCDDRVAQEAVPDDGDQQQQ